MLLIYNFRTYALRVHQVALGVSSGTELLLKMACLQESQFRQISICVHC
jgi:hypothetical protein